MKKLVLAITFCCLNGIDGLATARERVKLDGYAEWRHGDVLIVEGQRVHVDERTRFSGKGGAKSLGAIPLGYEVKVDGYRHGDGSVLARTIESKRNGSAMFEGELASASDATERHWRQRGYVFAEDGSRLGELYDDGPEVERVRRIVGRLVPPSYSASSFRAYVVENDAWNAMAAPNGSVFVFSGLLRATDDDEMAIILGHELVHATHEHSRRQYKRNLWTQLGLAGVVAVTEARGSSRDNGGGRSTLVHTGALLGALAFQNRYSRQHEDQADRVGLRYAHEAGYDVSKAPDLWRRFARKYGGQPEALNFFFGSHSTPAARSRNLEREIRRNYH
jgi:Zn-dependent protease with chaperone function